MLRNWFVFVLPWLIVATASGQVRRLSESDLVGLSDLVILGTLDSLERPGEVSGVAAISVQKTLKGKPVTSVRVSNLAWMVAGNVEKLRLHQTMIFFLQRIQGDKYAVTIDALGVRPSENEEKITAAITSFPIEITIMRPTGPFIIGQSTPVTIKMKNIGTAPIGFTAVELRGFYASPEMGNGISAIIAYPDPPSEHTDPEEVTPLKPGEEYEVTLPFTCRRPAAWKDDAAEERRADIALRARVLVDFELPHRSELQSKPVFSPLVETSIVLPIPTAKNKEEN
jgi:hypothetical protein